MGRVLDRSSFKTDVDWYAPMNGRMLEMNECSDKSDASLKSPITQNFKSTSTIAPPMRIFTCTPVPFGGGADFFSRDSGLLCRGFQAIGVESRAVMPGERKPEDEADLIRTDYRNLESAVWWRSQELDGVVLYAWGRPKFRKVAAAIQAAGIFLVLNLDSGGSVSPLTGLRQWLHGQRIYSGTAGLCFIRKTALKFVKTLFFTDPLRARHLKCGDVIASVSPAAADYFRRLCRVYGGKHLADRVQVIPHSVEARCNYSQREKRRQVVCVGRWSDRVQKRGWLLMEVLGELLAKDRRVTVVIAGERTPQLEQWHRELDNHCRERVELPGIIDREKLAELMEESQVFYSPSAFESFGIAAAEALCSGCSVVAGQAATMPAFGWFVSENSGQLAAKDDETGHAKTLVDELELWEIGERDPSKISQIWCERLHSDRVAAKIVELARQVVRSR